MLCAAFHRAGKSREYTVESKQRAAEREESLAQVLLEWRTRVQPFQMFETNI